MCGEKYEIVYRNGLNGRITPACAGKSFLALLFTQHCRDHPRMCGEKVKKLYLIGMTIGSPPHVRGKDDMRTETFGVYRITPACAGKSIEKFRN